MNAKSGITVSITPRPGETLITVRHRESDGRYSAMAHCSACGSSFSSSEADESSGEEAMLGWHKGSERALELASESLDEHKRTACKGVVGA